MKKVIKKVWNNKIFRTFFQTFIAIFAGGSTTTIEDNR